MHTAKGLEGSKGLNPYENRPYSHKYYGLFESRKKLPVYEFKKKILESVKNNNVVIIEGNTGSGKTTQIPQFILESGIIPPNKQLICTQPRRVAAINVAKRVADEMDCDLGGVVGFAVRFQNQTTNKTRLTYMTDGLLLREFIDDPLLNKYGIIIIDEAHERTINSDIILGLLHQILTKRNDLKVVVMSATLEASKFTNFFTINGRIPPHLSIPGRLFNVEIKYSDEDVKNYNEAAINTAVDIHTKEGAGDILIFLTGEEEIENCCTALRQKILPSNALGADIKEVKVLPLYSTLSLEDQSKVFVEPDKTVRKIVVSTNIAETSITINGIVYVIDCGLVKQTMYNPKRRMRSLQPVNISKASAVQRSGRAGRTQPGKCYRLYTEKSFNEVLEEQTPPEIGRSDLTSMLLMMLAIGITNLDKFPYIDRPHNKLLIAAIKELHYLGAIDDESKLTKTGRLMSVIPLEPSLSKALIASSELGCTKEVAAIACVVSEQGQVFLRPKKERKEAEMAHSQFKDPNSDHISILTAFEAFKVFGSQEWCEQNYLNFRVLDGALKAQGQLISLLHKYDIPIPSVSRANPERNKIILQGLLQGLFMKIAFLDNETKGYMFMNTADIAFIHRASTLFKKTPKCVLYSEYIFTDKDYIRTVSEIDESWVINTNKNFFSNERIINKKYEAIIQQLAKKTK